MDYEKEYKEALKRAKIWQEHLYEIGDKDYADELNYIFHELKESEDERVRKRILLSLEKDLVATKNSGCNTKDLEECIAWLEKQCEKQGKTAFEAIKEEKVDNANKVEPKFKVGDWVVNKFGDSWHIDSFDKKNYQVSDEKGNYNYFPIAKQDEMHLWTIQDAKDGDVLQLGEVTAIFKKYIGNEHCTCYCSFCEAGGFEIPIAKEDNVYGCYDDTTPATKEQCDLLFSKMKEAGYMWDAEKKELKNIRVIDEGKAEMDYCFTKMMNGEKVSSAWSEEDIFKVQRICKYLDEAKKYYADITEVRECMDWLKSLKERVQPQWKPEDIHLEALRCVINGNNLDVIALKDLLEQLKKL